MPSSTITSSTIITNSQLSGYTWPITISGGSSSSPVVVTFGDDLTFKNSTNYFFIIGSDYVTIDGGFNNVNINNVLGYLGLVQNGYTDLSAKLHDGFSNITIKNINILSTTSVLNADFSFAGGWVCQPFWATNATNCLVDNCSSNGPIHANCGGIVGGSSSGKVTNSYSTGYIGYDPLGPSRGNSGGIYGIGANKAIVENCYSTGIIDFHCGGIIGENSFSSTVTKCYSTGEIKGEYAGGIIGTNPNNNGSSSSGNTTVTECFSTGNITSYGGGGIVGGSAVGTITINYCYSTGNISGTRAGGILGDNYNIYYTNSLNCTINSCYSTGIIGTTCGGIIGSFVYNPSQTIIAVINANNCYTIGKFTNADGSGGLFAKGTPQFGSGGSGFLSAPWGSTGSFASGNNIWNDSEASNTLLNSPVYDSLNNLISQGSEYTDINLSNTTTPFKLTKFNSFIYVPTTDTTTNTSYTKSPTTIFSTYNIISVQKGTTINPTNTSVSINPTTGVLTFSSLTIGTYTVNVIGYKTDQLGGYQINNFTLTCTGSQPPQYIENGNISAANSIYLKYISSETNLIQLSYDLVTWKRIRPYAWPLKFTNTNTTNLLTVYIVTDLVFNASNTNNDTINNGYIVMKSNKITIEGYYPDNLTHNPPNTHTIEIASIPNYRGLTQNGIGSNSNYTSGSGYSNITVQNINLNVTGTSTLYTSSNDEAGWICQSYWSGSSSLINNLVYRCSSNGSIPDYAGGIIGVYSGGMALKCFSTGTIGKQAGGIFGGSCFSIASCCYSSGNFNSEGAGGIFGNYSTTSSQAINCYSRGTFNNDNIGGIFGINSSGSATNCYTTGKTTKYSNVGGIFGNNTTSSIDATNCYVFQQPYIGGGSGSVSNIKNSFIQNGLWSDANASKYLLWGQGSTTGDIWTSTGLNKPYNLYPLNNDVRFTISANNLYPIVTLSSNGSITSTSINLSNNNFIPNYSVTWNIDPTSTATGTFTGNTFKPTSIGVIKIYATINPIINGNRIYVSNDGSSSSQCISNTLLVVATTASSYNAQITDPTVTVTNSSSYSLTQNNQSIQISSPPNNTEVVKISPTLPAGTILNIVKRTNSDGSETLQFQMYNSAGEIITNSPGTNANYFTTYSTLKKINNLTKASVGSSQPINLIQNGIVVNSAYINYLGQNPTTGLEDYLIKQYCDFYFNPNPNAPTLTITVKNLSVCFCNKNRIVINPYNIIGLNSPDTIDSVTIGFNDLTYIPANCVPGNYIDALRVLKITGSGISKYNILYNAGTLTIKDDCYIPPNNDCKISECSDKKHNKKHNTKHDKKHDKKKCN